MSDFPKMLYRFPAQGVDPHALQDGNYDTRVVQSAEEQGNAVGWFPSPQEAKNPPAAEDNSPPTRAELEAKANELGIEFDGRTSDKKLYERIMDRLNESTSVELKA